MSRRWGWLAVGSLTQSILLAAFFLIPFSRMGGVMPPPPVDVAQQANPDDWPTLLAIGVVFAVPTLAPFLFFLRQPFANWVVPMSALVAALIVRPAVVSLATYPCCTGDVLDYINRQRMWAVYGGNPFVVVANDHPDDWSFY